MELASIAEREGEERGELEGEGMEAADDDEEDEDAAAAAGPRPGEVRGVEPAPPIADPLAGAAPDAARGRGAATGVENEDAEAEADAAAGAIDETAGDGVDTELILLLLLVAGVTATAAADACGCGASAGDAVAARVACADALGSGTQLGTWFLKSCCARCNASARCTAVAPAVTQCWLLRQPAMPHPTVSCLM